MHLAFCFLYALPGELQVTHVLNGSSHLVMADRCVVDCHGLVHGWFLFCFFSVVQIGFSHGRVGVGYALRVFPAVTRLTVYRRPQVKVYESLSSPLCVSTDVSLLRRPFGRV